MAVNSMNRRESLLAQVVTAYLEALESGQRPDRAEWLARHPEIAALAGVEIRITDLPDATLGLAQPGVIWLDVNAAGWGGFIDATPGDDSEFTTPGNEGEMNHIDLLSVLSHGGATGSASTTTRRASRPRPWRRGCACGRAGARPTLP